ncbi:MAG: PH domain-containing protein, partial [Mycobacterium sp.]
IEGLRFTKGSWARAQLSDDGELLLPAVTFATLPQLTEVSAGRVPNPYD